MGKRELRVGLDIGISSCGWAIISDDGNGNRRIEDAGTRIFNSGELKKGKSRKSQERRGFRSVRRILRRRHERKERIKRYLQYIHFMNEKEIQTALETMNPDIIPIKVKGLDKKLTKAELLQILIHTCNHRGYKDFYEITDEEIDETNKIDNKEAEAQKDEKINQQAANRLDQALKNSGCQTISEYICKHYTDEKTGRIDYRNKEYKNEERLIIRRKHNEKEIRWILKKQQEFYPELKNQQIDILTKILFAQRDFEDGPGNPNDAYRKYTGFLDSLGYCRFYPDEKRGFRNTVLGDVYAGINALSQYRYINKETGENKLTKEAAEIIAIYILQNGSITRTQAGKLLKDLNVEILGSEDIDKTLAKSFRYIKVIKKIAEANDISWQSLISKDDIQEYKPLSFLNQIGEICSSYQTPHRKEEELKKLQKQWNNIPLPDTFWRALKQTKFSGTSNVSYHHMKDAIEAFLQGDIYGNFQWEQIEKQQEQQTKKRMNIIPPQVLIQDEDIKDNPVVYRGINETRKVLNALLRIYGAVDEIHVEVADEVARSFAERKRLEKIQKTNKTKNDTIKKTIAELLHCDENDVKGSQMERYKLYQEQEGKCLYSGRPLGELPEILQDQNHVYEIDHIIPYSLILDNTLANKALVYGNENQAKGQQTPLMYLTGEKRKSFIERINIARKRKINPISNKKYDYLMLPTLYGDKAQELLSGWKSRNINDTRYITKYIVGLFKNHLQFGEKIPKVYGIRGHITSRFRKEWLGKNTWGSEEKSRENYLNHAADAIIIANLSKLDVEIAMDYEKLRQIKHHFGGIDSVQYTQFLTRASKRISNFYHVPEELVKDRLAKSKKTPSYIPNLEKEVDLRLGNPEGETRTEEEYKEQAAIYYGGSEFLVPPHRPLTSIKVEKKFKGQMMDSNPIRLVEENGIPYKISRKNIQDIKENDIENIYTSDGYLIAALQHVFAGQENNKYTVKNYMKEHNLSVFKTTNGQPIRKVSIKGKPVSNYYKKKINDTNYTIFGIPKYYCVEIYKDKKGNTKLWGLRYVDIISYKGKLYLKEGIKPTDYKEHKLYLFPGEYIEVQKKGKVIYKGTYQNVYSINQGTLRIKLLNKSILKAISIATNATVIKYDVSINGCQKGNISERKEGYPCFVH